MLPDSSYRGRFAPSPTGPLHFGSLATAVGSYVDAKHHNGEWLLRIEDLDGPRCVAGAADNILHTLEALGLHWDDEVMYQSRRTSVYEEALHELKKAGAVYPCCCSRKEIADSALHGIDGPVYPGTCRSGIRAGRTGRGWRVRTAYLEEGKSVGQRVEFKDRLQGRITQYLDREIGDFIVKRADGLFAYQLAVVVDDAYQGVTHVVRGADLLLSTPRQIHLQRLLGSSTPVYMHLPVAMNRQGEKLSKQTLAPGITADDAAATLIAALNFLGQEPPVEINGGTADDVLRWAVKNWRPERLKRCMQRPAPEHRRGALGELHAASLAF